MKIKNLSLFILALAFLISCKNSSKVNKNVFEEVELDTVEITASAGDFIREPYNPSYLRINDLLHTALEVSFDWYKQQLLGKATLKFKPVFYPTDSLRLDAKGFEIQTIVMKNGSMETALTYTYTDMKNIYIKLDRMYKRNEEYSIYIQYTAKPNDLIVKGSSAITADKGLYFINPMGEDPSKPQQIWTQGETESSSCWFPTIDRPNERTTQEIKITVEDRFKTLSNGLLKSSTKNSDGTRTDYWVMDMPHAPYLFMMAIGEFAIVKDNWNGIPVEYYVEPKFEKDAKAIFPFTPEMLTFFSERFGVKYPWQKYAQVVVRDYVSGAMENTTAVIFGEFVQNDSRTLIDNSDMNEGIVAHEMMHHWFGDLVTCESWSNLPLNESFANYSEYLWFEHKYGRDHADYIRMNEINGYMGQAVIQGDAQPLIRFNYSDKEDMFDAHSYNKGGTILHMLRKYLGDEAFFESLRVYLEENKFQAAEVHNLRLAFEKVTGEDLNWFFNQWFLTKGHPKLQISRFYNEEIGAVEVTLEQIQPFEESTIFILPMTLAVYTEENPEKPILSNIRMTEQRQTFRIPVSSNPMWISVDTERAILCERIEEQSQEEWKAQFNLSKRFQDKYDAIRELSTNAYEEEVKEILVKALSDPFWVIRANAIDALVLDKENEADKSIIKSIEKMAQTDPRPDVRAAAVEKMGATIADKSYLPVFKSIIENEKSYRVLNSTLISLQGIDNEAALSLAKGLEKSTENPTLLLAVAELYSNSGDLSYTAFFESNWKKMSDYSGISFFDNYVNLITTSKEESFTLQKVDYLKSIGMDDKNNIWHRYAVAAALRKMTKSIQDKNLNEKVKNALTEVTSNEKNPTLKNLYKSW